MKNIYYSLLLFLIISGVQVSAQLPVITVRFANPQYTASSQTLAMDVEFQSNTANQKLYGMNIRFFYDDVVLEYQSMGNFIYGYAQVPPMPPGITTSSSTGGATLFGFPAGHPFEFFNGAMQLLGNTSVYLSTTGWTRIFTIYFHVDDPAALNNPSFCPSLIWDLEANPANGGWLNGDDGVVISVTAPPPCYSAPTTENVQQYNWQYSGLPGTPYGSPVSTTCISTIPLTASATALTPSVCPGSQNGSVTVAPSGGNQPYTYLWNTVPPATTATLSGVQAGTYAVTVTDATGATAASSASIALSPQPDSYNVTGSGSYCDGSAGTIVGLSGSQAGVNYTLHPGNTILPGSGSPLEFGFQLAGTYTITAQTAAGCQSAMNGQAVITVNQPLPVSVSIEATSTTVVTDEAVTIIASPVNGGSSPAYQWKVNGYNAGSNNSVFILNPADGDVVNCVLTSSETCTSGNPAESNSITFTVQSVPPVQQVTGYVTSGETSCYNATETITVAGEGETFVVLSGASVNLIAGQKIQLLPGARVISGGYLHAWITANNQYCNAQQAPALPASVTSAEFQTGETAEGFTFLIYPNPAAEKVTISHAGKKLTSAQVTLSGMQGQCIFSREFTGDSKLLLDISSLPAGLYFVRIQSEGKTETHKLIRTH